MKITKHSFYTVLMACYLLFPGCGSGQERNQEETNKMVVSALDEANKQRIIALQNSKVAEESEKKAEELNSQFKRLFFLSTGEDIEITNPEDEEVYAKAYRVEIYLDEIYRSLIIRELEYFGEGGTRFIQERKVDLARVLKISEEETSKLSFKEWVKPNQFLLKLNDEIIDMTIMDNFNISIGRL